MGVVRYIDYATGRPPSMNMIEYIMHKDTYYSFEQEVRAVAKSTCCERTWSRDLTVNFSNRN